MGSANAAKRPGLALFNAASLLPASAHRRKRNQSGSRRSLLNMILSLPVSRGRHGHTGTDSRRQSPTYVLQDDVFCVYLYAKRVTVAQPNPTPAQRGGGPCRQPTPTGGTAPPGGTVSPASARPASASRRACFRNSSTVSPAFAVNRRPLLLRLFWGKCIVSFLGQPEPNNNPSWPITQACLDLKRRSEAPVTGLTPV